MSMPIASNDTADGRAQNRRVEFKVSNAPNHVDVVHEPASAASTDAAEHGQPKAVHRHYRKKATAAETAPANDDQPPPQ